MAIQCRHDEIIRTTPERAFAAIDDLSFTSKWLPPCVSLTKESDGPNVVGDKLRYVYKQGGREAEMVGEIVARVPGERLHCTYSDSMFEVSVDLRVRAGTEGTVTTHTVAITPKSLMGKLLGPLIRFGLRRQTREAARNLRTLLESADRP
jgi:uncharacterized protein YndB with AHSA1/START domain